MQKLNLPWHSVIKIVNEHRLGKKSELRTITGYMTSKSPLGYSRMSQLNVWTSQIGQKRAKRRIWFLFYKTSSLSLLKIHPLSEAAFEFAASDKGFFFGPF